MRLALPQPSLIVLVGPSGAGKSTFCERHFAPTAVVSSDECRALVSDTQDFDPLTSDSAFRVFHAIIAERLELGRIAIADSTALLRNSRQRMLALAHSRGVPAIAIVLRVPLDICLERDGARARHVGRAVLESQERLLEAALLSMPSEGFARVIELSPEDLDTAEVVIEAPTQLVVAVNEQPLATAGPQPGEAMAEARHLLGDRFPTDATLASARERLAWEGDLAPWRFLLPTVGGAPPMRAGGSLAGELRRLGSRRALARAVPANAGSALIILAESEQAAATIGSRRADGGLWAALASSGGEGEGLPGDEWLAALHRDLLTEGVFARFGSPVLAFDVVVRRGSGFAVQPVGLAFPLPPDETQAFWAMLEVDGASSLFSPAPQRIWDSAAGDDAGFDAWVAERTAAGDRVQIAATFRRDDGTEVIRLGGSAPEWVVEPESARRVDAPDSAPVAGTSLLALRKLGQRAVARGDFAGARDVVAVGWALRPEWGRRRADEPLFGQQSAL